MPSSGAVVLATAMWFAAPVAAEEGAVVGWGEVLAGKLLDVSARVEKSHELTLTLKVVGPKPVRLRLAGPLLAVPQVAPFMGVALPWKSAAEAPGPRWTLREAQQRESETLDAQVLLVGPARDRGGIAGKPILELAPNVPTTLVLPVWRTRLGRFRPLPDVAYLLYPAEDAVSRPELKRFCRWTERQGCSWGTAQAFLWSVCEPLAWNDLRTLKRQELREVETAFAEHLFERLAETDDPAAVGPPPAKVHLQIINRTGDLALPTAKRLGILARNGGLFGVPTDRTAIDDAEPETPAEFAAACGCQWSLMQAGETLSAAVLLRFWDGRSFEPQREFRVGLGNQPTPETAWRHVEEGILNEMIVLDRVPDDGRGPRTEIANRFPWAIRRLVLVSRRPGPAGSDEWTLDELAVGPYRTVRIPLPLVPADWKIQSVSWGF